MANYDDILRRILLRRGLAMTKTAGKFKPPILSLNDLLFAAGRGEDISKLPQLMANRIKGIEFPAHMPLADRVRIVEQAIKDKDWASAKVMLDQFLRGGKIDGPGLTSSQIESAITTGNTSLLDAVVNAAANRARAETIQQLDLGRNATDQVLTSLALGRSATPASDAVTPAIASAIADLYKAEARAKAEGIPLRTALLNTLQLKEIPFNRDEIEELARFVRANTSKRKADIFERNFREAAKILFEDPAAMTTLNREQRRALARAVVRALQQRQVARNAAIRARGGTAPAAVKPNAEKALRELARAARPADAHPAAQVLSPTLMRAAEQSARDALPIVRNLPPNANKLPSGLQYVINRTGRDIVPPEVAARNIQALRDKRLKQIQNAPLAAAVANAVQPVPSVVGSSTPLEDLLREARMARLDKERRTALSVVPPAAEPPPTPPPVSPPVSQAPVALLPPPAAQQRSLWPWILGGAGLATAGGIGAYYGLREDDSFAGRVRRHLRSLGIDV